jgi:hypothetical protein
MPARQSTRKYEGQTMIVMLDFSGDTPVFELPADFAGKVANVRLVQLWRLAPRGHKVKWSKKAKSAFLAHLPYACRGWASRLRFSDPQERMRREAQGYPRKAKSSTEINSGVQRNHLYLK